jgi:hypothetical protein
VIALFIFLFYASLSKREANRVRLPFYCRESVGGGWRMQNSIDELLTVKSAAELLKVTEGVNCNLDNLDFSRRGRVSWQFLDMETE